MSSANPIVFRVDASLEIGNGHVMRCLSLAAALRERGAASHFACAAHAGHLGALISAEGHGLSLWPPDPAPVTAKSHASGFHVDASSDAGRTAGLLDELHPDWLVVDHYGIGSDWESPLRGKCGRLMAIDDLADRRHACDLLLDQNLGRSEEDYGQLVGTDTMIVVGPGFALLRGEFAMSRDKSLARRAAGQLETILISMGGVDLPNATARILSGLSACLPAWTGRVIVVLGPTSPWLAEVTELSARMPFACEVVHAPPSVGSIMAGSDLCIGATGSSAWERCCLGLPSIVMTIADNQSASADALVDAGAAINRLDPDQIEDGLRAGLAALFRDGALQAVSRAAAAVCDGAGAGRMADLLCGARP